MNPVKTAFIIDDDQVFTYLLAKRMKMASFCENVQMFPNGLDAVNYLLDKQHSPEELPAVILLDLNMPVLDGWQFLDKFSQMHLDKKIIVYIISSSIDAADHEKAAGYHNVAGFYVKPVSEETLQEILSNVKNAE